VQNELIAAVLQCEKAMLGLSGSVLFSIYASFSELNL